MRSHGLIAGFVLITICLFNGCGRAPQMQTPNRKLLEALQTAVSSKNTKWVQAVATQAAARRDQKEMSDAEFKAIDAIVKKAQSGDWKRAQMDSFALREGQRPTAEDLAAMNKRKADQNLSSN